MKHKCTINRFFNVGLSGWLLPAGQRPDNAICSPRKDMNDGNEGLGKRMTRVLFIYYSIAVHIFARNHSSLWQNNLGN